MIRDWGTTLAVVVVPVLQALSPGAAEQTARVQSSAGDKAAEEEALA